MLLNLISWNIRKQPLADWLVEEICRRYFITKRVARYWVEHDKLLLLLDGFDEVEVDAREHCIKTINEFLTHHPLPVAICSRDTDYMAQVGRLNLERAILVQRLSHAQIDEYLTNLQLPESFRTLVTQEDPYLAELAATPMLLHLLINTVDGQKTLTHSSSVVGQNTYFQLFEAYIHHMLAGRNNQPEPIADTAVYTHLGWIAEQMQCQSLNLFVVEQLQPICLPHLSERIQYVLVSRLLVGTVGGIVGGLFIGAAYAVFNGAGMEGLMRGLVEGLISGVCGGLIIGAIDRWRLTHRNWRSVADTVHGFVGMLIETGIITLSVGLTVWIGIVLFLGLPRWLAYSLTFWANEGGIVGLLAGLTFGLFFGYKQWTTGHYRFQDDIATVEQISWSNPDALRGTGYGLIFGILGGVFIWLNAFDMAITTIFPGVSIVGLLALIGIVLGALFGGLTGQVITVTNRSSQTTMQSLRSSVQLALVIAGICALIGFFVGVISATSWRAVATLAVYGLFAAPLAFLWYGGIDMIKHLILRWLLWRRGQMPWQIHAFLSIATRAALLRRAGNGYQFIHPPLLEHFVQHPSRQRVMICTLKV
ncbi:MAG: hypothetical protein R2932_57115 [Caldilineaceae bacterium]